MNEEYEIFRKFADITRELWRETSKYIDVPRRRHKRPRIQKKWLKRFGTRRKYIRLDQHPVHSTYDTLGFDKRFERLVYRQYAKVRQNGITVPYTSNRPMTEAVTSNAYSVPVTCKTYTFQPIASQIEITPEMYQQAWDRMKVVLHEQFEADMRRLFENNSLQTDTP